MYKIHKLILAVPMVVRGYLDYQSATSLRPHFRSTTTRVECVQFNRRFRLSKSTLATSISCCICLVVRRECTCGTAVWWRRHHSLSTGCGSVFHRQLSHVLVHPNWALRRRHSALTSLTDQPPYSEADDRRASNTTADASFDAGGHAILTALGS